MNCSSAIACSEHLLYIADQYDFYVNLFVMPIGLVGNFMIILIMTTIRLFHEHQCAFYLISESFSNIGLLSLFLPSRILTFIFKTDPYNWNRYWCKARSWLANMFFSISLSIICSSAFDQYLSTHYRYSYRKRSSIKLARILAILSVVFGVIHHLPLFIFSDVDQNAGCIIINTSLRTYYSMVFYPILNLVVPFCLSFILSCLAFRNVRHLIRLQVSSNRRNRDRQLTAMVLVRVLNFTVMSIPYATFLLYRFYANSFSINRQTIALQRLLNVISTSLFYGNYSINFYLFLLISARFRHQTRHFFVKAQIFLQNITHCSSNRIRPTHPQPSIVST